MAEIKNGPAGFLENFGRALAAATFILLTLSLTREWGYFGVIGREYQSSLTTYDYLVSTLAWLPSLIIVWFFLGLIYYKAGPAQLARSTLHSWVYNSVGGLFVLSALATFFAGGAIRVRAPFTYTVAFLYLWGSVSGRVAPRLNQVPAEIAALCLGAPILLSIALGYGVSAGYQALEINDQTYSLLLREEREPYKVVLLRDLEKGILVRPAGTTEIIFYPWDRIARLSHPVTIPTQSHSCEIFGWPC